MGKRAAASFLFVLGLMSVTTGAVFFQQLGSGMLGYWKCDDTGAPTVDSSGNGNDGTWTGAVSALTGAANTPAATSFSTGCLNFNSVDAKVSVPGTNALTLTGDFTIAFWMYPNADAADWQRMVGKGEGATPAAAVNRTFGVWREPGGGHHILFQQYNNGNAVINITTNAAGPASNGTTPNTAWTHVACRVSGTAATVWLNGAQGIAGTRSGTPTAVATDPLTFGGASFHTSFPGRLDDIRYYNRALSNQEIIDLAAGLQGPPAPVLSATYGTTTTALTWTGTATVFNVKRSSSPGGPYTTVASNVAANAYTDNAIGYFYVVSGVTYGEGPNSNEVAPPVSALPNTGLTTSEIPTSTNFRVTFNQAIPAGDTVRLTITSSDSTEGTVSDGGASAAQITHDVVGPQLAGYYVGISVDGVPDLIADGPQPYSISVTTSCTTNATFNNLTIPPVQVTNLEDSDTAGVSFNKTVGLLTTEAGATDTFSATLRSQPNNVITVTLTNNNPGEVSLSQSVLTFNPTNWNVPQVVTLTGVDDTLLDFTQPFTITGAVGVTDPVLDFAYVGLAVPTISGINLDDEVIPPAKGAWGGGNGGCGLLGLEIGLPLLALRLRRRRRSA